MSGRLGECLFEQASRKGFGLPDIDSLSVGTQRRQGWPLHKMLKAFALLWFLRCPLVTVLRKETAQKVAENFFSLEGYGLQGKLFNMTLLLIVPHA